jgi:hypothetical protein
MEIRCDGYQLKELPGFNGITYAEHGRTRAALGIMREDGEHSFIVRHIGNVGVLEHELAIRG